MIFDRSLNATLKIAALVLIGGWIHPAMARELYPDQYANAPFHAWYEAQRNKVGGSCCREADAHAFYGHYMLNPDGSVDILDGKNKTHVDASKVLDGPNPTGHAVWWYLDYGDRGKTTYCFAPGAGG